MPAKNSFWFCFSLAFIEYLNDPINAFVGTSCDAVCLSSYYRHRKIWCLLAQWVTGNARGVRILRNTWCDDAAIKIALDVVIQPIKMFIKQLHTSAITFHINWHALMNQLWNTHCNGCRCRSSTKMRKCFRTKGDAGDWEVPKVARWPNYCARKRFRRSKRLRTRQEEISAHLRGRGHDTREISFISSKRYLRCARFGLLFCSPSIRFASLRSAQEILLITRVVSINTPKRRKSKAFRHLLCFYVACLLAYSKT